MSNLQRAGSAETSAAEARVVGLLGHVRELLVPGEQIEAWATQRRLFALWHRRVLVVATSGRLVVFARNLIAGYQMHDVRWQDLHSAHIRVGLWGADLTIGHFESTDLAIAERPSHSDAIRGLRKAQAEDVYRLCQAHDQAWREKRRIRDLEEMRARAGGVQIGAGAPAAALAASGSVSEPTERLQRARDMLAKGLITDSEYEGIKARIISGL